MFGHFFNTCLTHRQEWGDVEFIVCQNRSTIPSMGVISVRCSSTPPTSSSITTGQIHSWLYAIRFTMEFVLLLWICNQKIKFYLALQLWAFLSHKGLIDKCVDLRLSISQDVMFVCRYHPTLLTGYFPCIIVTILSFLRLTCIIFCGQVSRSLRAWALYEGARSGARWNVFAYFE